MRKLRTITLLILFVALLALFAVGGGYPTRAQGASYYLVTIDSSFWSGFPIDVIGFGGGAHRSNALNVVDIPFNLCGSDEWRGVIADTSVTKTFDYPSEDPANQWLVWGIGSNASASFSYWEPGDRDSTYQFNGSTSIDTPSIARSIFFSQSGLYSTDAITYALAAWPGAGLTVSAPFNLGFPGTATNLSIGLNLGVHGIYDPDGVGSITAGYVICFGTGGVTPTPTISPTPTLGSAPAGNFEGQCFLLGDDSSLFMTLPGVWTLTPSTLGHGASNTGLLLKIGQATITLNLNKYHKYQIALRFHVEDPASGDIFSWQLGSTLATTVSAEATADEQTFLTGAAGQNYEPDNPAAADIYTFTLKELLHVEDNGTLVIDLACIEDRTPDVQLVPVGGENTPPGICTSCDYNPTGNLLNDLMAIFGWLWCGLSHLWDCVLKPLLLGLWKTVIDILRWLNFVRIWAGLLWERYGVWLNSAFSGLVNWWAGGLANVLTMARNILIAFLNTQLGQTLLNLIFSFLYNPLAAIIQNTAHTVATVSGAVGDLVQMGVYYMGLIINAILSVLGAIPEIFIALINGYNASPTSIPIWAPTCNSANTFLYYPCLGSYILDNTVFDGPTYLAAILVMGLIAVNTLLWSVRAVQESFSK